MIDLEEIRKYFRKTIIDSGVIDVDNIQFENTIFNASGKSIWMSESYLNVDETFSDSVNGDELQGILSYNINVEVGQRETVATTACVALGNLFKTATVVETDNYKISIGTPKRSFQGILYNNSKWYTIVLDVEFKAYE